MLLRISIHDSYMDCVYIVAGDSPAQEPVQASGIEEEGSYSLQESLCVCIKLVGLQT